MTATASKVFQDNNLNVLAFELGLVNLLAASFILGGHIAYFPLYALAQVRVCASVADGGVKVQACVRVARTRVCRRPSPG